MNLVNLRRGAVVLCLIGVVLGRAAPMPVQVAEARNGMVAAGHPDATAAGVAVLQAGGNAVDAAVAVGFALGVTEPYGSGVGGKLSLLYRDARTGTVTVVEALDAASAHLDEAEFRRLPAAERNNGVHSVAVPGFVAGMMEAHERWGVLPRADVLAPAIRLAEEGFEVRPLQVRFFRSQAAKLRSNEELSRIYLPDGRMPEAGQRLVNADLGRTLRAVAAQGAPGFYEGPVAEAMLRALREAGSPLRAEDFAAYRARIDEPLRTNFRGTVVYSAPPPVSGGGVFLMALAALEAERLPGESALKPEAMDRWMRVFIEADAVCREVLGDREGSRREWERLMGEARLAELRRRASEGAASVVSASWSADEQEALAAETTHFVVVDREGNVVSATQSQSNHFGSGIVPPGTGVVMNNSLSNFNRIPNNPNEVAAGRRPRTTITPAVIVREGRLVAGIGLPGGSRIPSAMVQVTTDYLMFGRPLEEAIGAPRFHPVTRRPGQAEVRFETERETDHRVADALRRMGWRDGTDAETESFGGMTAVELLPDGRLRGYADQRRSNTAMGF